MIFGPRSVCSLISSSRAFCSRLESVKTTRFGRARFIPTVLPSAVTPVSMEQPWEFHSLLLDQSVLRHFVQTNAAYAS